METRVSQPSSAASIALESLSTLRPVSAEMFTDGAQEKAWMSCSISRVR